MGVFWGRALDEPGSTLRRCSHPYCRQSLDEYPTECPHGMPFCEDCIWEECCAECAARGGS